MITFADLLGQPRPCGRWGYICDRLYCRERCARTDEHGRNEHRCTEHAL